MAGTKVLLLSLVVATSVAHAQQQPLSIPIETDPLSKEDIYKFPHPIRRVAVIGAGPSGIQSAAILIDHGFEVRLFDRKRLPGGVWDYTPEDIPIPANFPNKPIEVAAYTPDIPSELPLFKVLEDDDDSELTNEWRLREHWNPSPVYRDLTSNSLQAFTKLPGVEYPEDTEWVVPLLPIQRHVRQYASLHGLNSNDEEHREVTSYSTRVERIHKAANASTWTLTLKRLVEIAQPWRAGSKPKTQLQADWWTEEFDAVVVATNSYDSTYVPSIPGLNEWAHAYPNQIYHSRNYRTPEQLAGKNVLIVGASISASEIARNIVPYAANYSICLRHHDTLSSVFKRKSLRKLPANITHIAEIKSFSELPVGLAAIADNIRHLTLNLVDGTNITGFDEIILATGYRRSSPFLAGFHNTTIIGKDEPDVVVPPLITDGTHLRSLHWTGHYIADPTLAFTHLSRPWTDGQYQSLGFAKVWSGKADLPSVRRMWATYPGPGKDINQIDAFGGFGEEATPRLWVAWLNNASLKYGGRFVSLWPIQLKEEFVYFADRELEMGWVTSANFTRYENTPRSQWPSRSDSSSDFGDSLSDDTFEIESADKASRDGTVEVWGNFAIDHW